MCKNKINTRRRKIFFVGHSDVWTFNIFYFHVKLMHTHTWKPPDSKPYGYLLMCGAVVFVFIYVRNTYNGKHFILLRGMQTSTMNYKKIQIASVKSF